jgi:hypothetical protein
MSVSSNQLMARVFGALSVFWVAFYSKYHSLGDPGDPIELITFFCPFLITHWFLKQTPYLEKSPTDFLYPTLPIFGVAAAMIISSVYHGQSIMHAQGPSLWVWATACALLIRHWKFEFIVKIGTMALVGYALYFLAVQCPAVQNRSSGSLRYLYENQNILSFYVAGLFFLSRFASHISKSSFAVAALVLFVLIHNGSIFGCMSYLAALVVLLGYEHFLFPAAAFFTGMAIFVKQTLLGSSDAIDVRLQILTEGMKQGMESFIFGAGHGHKIFIDLRPGFRIDHPHNFLVQSFRAAGTCGVMAIFALLACLLKIWKRLHLQQRALLTFFLLWSLADDWFMWHGTILFFVLGCTLFKPQTEAT